MTARTERFHDIDGMRGLLMVLGVFFHSALIYQAGSFHDQFIVILQDISWSPVWDWPILFSNVMRMPCFFIISGFLMGLALAKRPVGSVLGKRLVRIVVPLVTAAVLLVPMQGWVLHLAGGGSGWPWTPYLSSGQPYDPYSYSASVSYLWFLINLAVYMTLISLWWALARRFPQSWRAIFDGPWLTGPVGWLAMAAIIIACRVADRAVTAQAIIQFAPFFFIGVWLSLDVERYRSYSTFTWWRVVLAVGVFLAFGALAMSGDLPAWQRLLKRGLEAVAAVGLSSQVLGVGRWLFSRPMPALRRLSDASYTIYLLHQPLVLWLAWQLRGQTWHPLIKFVIVSFAVTVATYYCHRFIVNRLPMLTVLLNGRVPRSSPQSPAAAAPDQPPGAAVALSESGR